MVRLESRKNDNAVCSFEKHFTSIFARGNSPQFVVSYDLFGNRLHFVYFITESEVVARRYYKSVTKSQKMR